MIDAKVQEDSLRRLRKIEGQIKGIQKMVEERKYCIDIINQITAVRRALHSVSMLVMERHMQSCVTEAMRSRNKSERATKIEELMDVFSRFGKA